MSCRCSLPPSGVAVDLCVPSPGTAHLAVVSARLSGKVLCLHGCKKMGAAPPQPRAGLNGVGAPGAALDQWWTEAECRGPSSAVSQLGRLPEACSSSLPSGGFQQGGAPGVHLFGGAFPSPTHFSPLPWWFPWGHLPDALFSFPALVCALGGVQLNPYLCGCPTGQ